MLFPTIEPWFRRSFLFAAVLLATTAWQPARAEEAANASLSMVPADAAFYSAQLHAREQVQRVARSNAWKVLHAMPFVKDALAKMKEEMDKQPGFLAGYQQLMEDKDNKELVDLLLDGLSNDVFLYGGKGWVDFFHLYNQLTPAIRENLSANLENPGDNQKSVIRSVLLVLKKHRKRLQAPEMVFGFKVKDPQKAVAQLGRLEKLIPLVDQNVPPLKGKIHRGKKAGGDFVTVELDGSLIPLDALPLKDVEEKKGEFDDLIQHIKKSKLTISLGVKGGFILLGVSSSIKDLETLGGGGKSLADVDEMKPLRKHAQKPVVGIGYASKAFMASVLDGMVDFGGLANLATAAIEKADLPDKLKKGLEKDVKAVAAHLQKATLSTGAAMSFSLMTPTGYESYGYSYGQGAHYQGVACRLQNHIGGNPIMAFVVGGKLDGSLYAELVKWAQRFYGHAEEYYLSTADDDAKAEYKKNKAVFLPLLKRLDEITTTMLIPSMKQTGFGLVLDAKWTSKQWHTQMPETTKALPMPELGLLLGLDDDKMFLGALDAYRKTLNEAYAKVREASPNKDAMPEFALPAMKARKKTEAGALYPFPSLAALGVDEQVQPTAAVGKHVALLAFSSKHAERLLARTPLKAESGPLTHQGALVAVVVLNWPALVDAVMPWVENTIETQGPANGKKNLLEQVRTGVSILKTFKGVNLVSYVEGDAVVSHSEMVFKDLPTK